jgi:hypothetical protein
MLKLLTLSARAKENSTLTQFSFYEVTLLGYFEKHLIPE